MITWHSLLGIVRTLNIKGRQDTVHMNFGKSHANNVRKLQFEINISEDELLKGANNLTDILKKTCSSVRFVP